MTQSPTKRKLLLSKEIENKLRNAISNDDFNSFSTIWNGKTVVVVYPTASGNPRFPHEQASKWAKEKMSKCYGTLRWPSPLTEETKTGKQAWKYFVIWRLMSAGMFGSRALSAALYQRNAQKQNPISEKWLDDPKRRQVAAEVLSWFAKPRSAGKKSIAMSLPFWSYIRSGSWPVCVCESLRKPFPYSTNLS